MSETLILSPEDEVKPDDRWSKALNNVEGVLRSRVPVVDQDMINSTQEILRQMSKAEQLKLVHHIYHRPDGSTDEYRGVWLPSAETPAGGLLVDELTAMLGTVESSEWFSIGGVPESDAYREELEEALGKPVILSFAEFSERPAKNTRLQRAKILAQKVLLRT